MRSLVDHSNKDQTQGPLVNHSNKGQTQRIGY